MVKSSFVLIRKIVVKLWRKAVTGSVEYFASIVLTKKRCTRC